jgi:hypothetical protein
MTMSWTPDPSRVRLFADFCRFAKAQVESGDIDPMYPTLKRFYAAEKIGPEAALWRTLLYVTWYHVGSAERAWTRWPSPGELPVHAVASFPTGTERRGFRGLSGAGRAVAFVRGVLRAAGGNLSRWVESFGEGQEGWKAARRALEAIDGAGPWASYKWTDLLVSVHGLPFEATDIGVGGQGETAGPVCGMVLLTGRPWKDCATKVYLQRGLLDAALLAGVPFRGLDQLETALCDFNSLSKGGYYHGHDIDQQMSQLSGSGAGLWEARTASFADRFRGEASGWIGVRKDWKRAYADRKELVNL